MLCKSGDRWTRCYGKSHEERSDSDRSEVSCDSGGCFQRALKLRHTATLSFILSMGNSILISNLQVSAGAHTSHYQYNHPLPYTMFYQSKCVDPFHKDLFSVFGTEHSLPHLLTTAKSHSSQTALTQQSRQAQIWAASLASSSSDTSPSPLTYLSPKKASGCIKEGHHDSQSTKMTTTCSAF